MTDCLVVVLGLNMPGPWPMETAAGVAAYVLEDEATAVVLDAIRTVMRGGTWFSRPVVEKLARLEREESSLTDREWEILDLMARGWDNAGIAAELGLAKQTVRNYVSRIYAALEVSTRAEVAVRGVAGGLGYWLDRFDLLYSRRGVVFGASYTDIHGELLALNVLTALAVLVAMLLLANLITRNWWVPAGAIGLWLVVNIALRGIYPAILQNYVVEPNEFDRERPYIQYNINSPGMMVRAACLSDRS